MDHHRPGSNRLYKTGERKFFTVDFFLYCLTKFKNGMAFGRTNTEAVFHNVPPPAAIIDLQKLDTLLAFHCTANCDPAPLF